MQFIYTEQNWIKGAYTMSANDVVIPAFNNNKNPNIVYDIGWTLLK